MPASRSRSFVLPFVLIAIGLSVLYGHFCALVLIGAGLGGLLDSYLLGYKGRHHVRPFFSLLLLCFGAFLLLGMSLPEYIFRVSLAAFFIVLGVVTLFRRGLI